MEREIKSKIVRKLTGYDLEYLEKWLLKYNQNLHKLGINNDVTQRLSMFFLIADFLNVRNEAVLAKLSDKIEEEFKDFSLDLSSIEEVIEQIYTENIESAIQKLKYTKRDRISFEGSQISVRELEKNFVICTGDGTTESVLSIGTNENLAIRNITNKPIYGYLGFNHKAIKGMSNQNDISREDMVFDDIYGLVSTTRNGANSIIAEAKPSYILALDEITEEDKKEARERNISIYFIDRTKLAISEAQRLEQIEQEFFTTFNPDVLKKLIITYFNNRNSFRDRPDLQEEYFDSLQMQIKLEVIIEELEKCFDSKAERRAKLCLQYIYEQLEKEESLMSDSPENTDEMNINYLKNNIQSALGKRRNKLIEDTTNQAIKDIEEMGNLSEVEKAYYMYLKLGSVFKHDPTYTLETNRGERAIIYQYEIDADGYGICKSMVEEYQKALRRIGIDSEITEVIPGGKYTHKDLIIKTKDGKNYFTNLIGDLSNIQNGKRTRRFGVGEEEIKKSASDSEEYYKKITNQVGELTVIPQEQLEEMDNKFHHSYKGIYTNDMFQMLRKEIRDKEVLAEFFGTDDKDALLVKTFEFLLEHVGIVNSYNLENMGFYEATRYYDRLFGSTFTSEEKEHFRSFSDMYTIDENRERKPGCVVVLNANLINPNTGRKEIVDLYYEYSDNDKRFHKVDVDEILSKNYILTQGNNPNEPLNEIIRKMEEERAYINDFISFNDGETPNDGFDYTDK